MVQRRLAGAIHHSDGGRQIPMFSAPSKSSLLSCVSIETNGLPFIEPFRDDQAAVLEPMRGAELEARTGSTAGPGWPSRLST